MTDKNIIAMSGGDITDMELIEEYGLDPALAGKPAINDAMLDIVYQKNMAAMVDSGMSEGKAKAEAGRLRAQAKHQMSKKK